MKTAGFVGWSLLGIASCLVGRRILKIRIAKRLFAALSDSLELRTKPKSFFRVAISGTTSGIGKACVELLAGFESVELLKLSRRSGSADTFKVDLGSKSSCRSCADFVVDKWFKARSDVPGRDIFIHNAGLFSSAHGNDVWQVNALSPSYITERLCESREKTETDRPLRIVCVGSRLEKKSLLNRSNIGSAIRTELRNGTAPPSEVTYADTKRSVMLHTAFMFTKYKDPISFGVVTPGMVNTNIGRSSVSWLVWWISWPVRYLLLKHPIEGAVAVLYAAFSNKSGLYTGDPNEVLEYMPECRSAEEGRIISEIVGEHFC